MPHFSRDVWRRECKLFRKDTQLIPGPTLTLALDKAGISNWEQVRYWLYWAGTIICKTKNLSYGCREPEKPHNSSLEHIRASLFEKPPNWGSEGLPGMGRQGHRTLKSPFLRPVVTTFVMQQVGVVEKWKLSSSPQKNTEEDGRTVENKSLGSALD